MPIEAQTASLRVLLLGGTGEAHEIATRLTGLPGLTIISSLAGRVATPRLPAGLIRIGGFGGVSGLTTYLVQEQIDVVIDATHPFAVNISRNAEAACTKLGLPLIAFERLPWTKVDGDYWYEVPDMESATLRVAERKGRCLLAVGRQEVSAFAGCNDTWFLIRAIDPPQDPMPPHTRIILQRGPFDLQQELALLRESTIDYVVSKNSGGAATYSKIEAARILGIPVIMIQRPLKHTVPALHHLEEVLAALRTMERGHR
jgi:precorrin-6A/cobalt-precorrin-6A reductase